MNSAFPSRPRRRDVLAGLAGAAATFSLPKTAFGQAPPKVVAIGGGFAGATCARALKENLPNASVQLIEPNETFIACPFSNEVIAGLREIAAQQFGYYGIRKAGVNVIKASATSVDTTAKTVALSDGVTLGYDRLVVSPGIDLRFDALPGYDAAAAETLPHAWKAGPQTLLLRKQLEAMEDGGTVIISAPANPFRCPPGPYERASLIAYYLKTKKPRSKLLILDAKDVFSKQKLFQVAWKELYPNLEWVGESGGGKVIRVDAKTMSVESEFGSHVGNVINIIPPQRAGAIAQSAGVADQTGWCPIDPTSFESRLKPGIHIIGDAAIAGAMPKSAFAANAQAKACADAVTALLQGEKPTEPRLINTCYSLAAPGYGISVAGVYKPTNGLLADIPGAGGTSPDNAPTAIREQEATYADAWFKAITNEVFG